MDIQNIKKVVSKMNIQKSDITNFSGCYVTSGNEVISRFDVAVSQMNKDDFAQYLKIFRHIFAGKPEKTLYPLRLKKDDVDAGEKQLGNLYQMSKGNLDQIDALFKTIIQNMRCDSNYLILVANEEMKLKIKKEKICYPHIAAAICKVAHAPSVLCYTEDKLFLDGSAGSMVSDVEFGFVYPSMNDHQPDLSEALVYAKQGHLSDYDDLLHDIFNTNAPMDSSTKNEELEGILDNAFGTLKMDTVLKMQDHISKLKLLYGNQDFRLDAEKFEGMLFMCGVSLEKAAEGKKAFEEKFGADGLMADAVIHTESMKIKTGKVSIKISNIEENEDLLFTRMIGGVPYILIQAENFAEINGIKVELDK